MEHGKRPDQSLVPTSQLSLPGSSTDPPIGPYVPRPQDRVTVGKTASMRDDWYDSVGLYLGQQQHKTEETKRLIAGLRKEKRESAPSPEDAGKNILKEKELEAVFDHNLPHHLVARSSAAMGKPLDETAVEVRDSYIRHMNQRKDWSTIQHPITEPGGQQLTSTITPVNAEFHEQYAGYGHTGLGSMSGRLTADRRSPEEKTRPTNLWKTELERDGKPLFEALRSGAFVDNAADPDEKRANADAKGRAVLEAALIDRLKGMDDRERQAYLTGGQTFNGTMVSIDLLSGSGPDSKLAREHHETLQRLSGQRQDYNITWDGQQHTIPASWNILDFMAGVNGFNTPIVGPVPNPVKTTSSGQADQNDRSWTGLKQHALAQMTALEDSRDPEEQTRAAKIAALTSQLQGTDMGRSGDYQMPAMVANLAYQLGHSVHFNCKSGKDRTGIMDAESKFMARQLDKDPTTVPNVASPKARTPLQNYEHEQMLWESGSLDVLAQNVGGQCLKTADLKGKSVSDTRLMENLGGEAKLKELAGLKRYADIDTIATFDQKVMGMQMPMMPWTKKGFQKSGEEYVSQLPAPIPKPLPPIPQRAPQVVGPPQVGAQPLPVPVPVPLQNVVQPLLPPVPDVDAQPPLVRDRPKGVPGNAVKLF